MLMHSGNKGGGSFSSEKERKRTIKEN